MKICGEDEIVSNTEMPIKYRPPPEIVFLFERQFPFVKIDFFKLKRNWNMY